MICSFVDGRNEILVLSEEESFVHQTMVMSQRTKLENR